ncbi:hypothetical protein Mapa_017833 [Marchantia paleacea]|nr:hypothetical protein Mapa_017833 [Marchantia paleacea]
MQILLTTKRCDCVQHCIYLALLSNQRKGISESLLNIVSLLLEQKTTYLNETS